MVLDVGQYGSLWDINFSEASQYIQSHSLLYHMWDYNVTNDIQITLNHVTITAQREGDTSIMKCEMKLSHTKKELRSIQNVRMKLNVVHISDITTADGCKLEPKFYSTTLPSINRCDYNWPLKHHITSQDISTWRKFLKLSFNRPQNSLNQSLGPWNSMTDAQWIDNWDFFLL